MGSEERAFTTNRHRAQWWLPRQYSHAHSGQLFVCVGLRRWLALYILSHWRKRRDLDVDNVAYFFEFAVNSLYDQHSRKELHHRGNKKSNPHRQTGNIVMKYKIKYLLSIVIYNLHFCVYNV